MFRVVPILNDQSSFQGEIMRPLAPIISKLDFPKKVFERSRHVGSVRSKSPRRLGGEISHIKLRNSKFSSEQQQAKSPTAEAAAR